MHATGCVRIIITEFKNTLALSQIGVKIALTSNLKRQVSAISLNLDIPLRSLFSTVHAW